MSTTYSFVTGDTANNAVAVSTLVPEVEASGTSVNFTGISSPSSGNYTLSFDRELVTGDVTILDGVIAAHQGIAAAVPPTTVKLIGPEEVDGKPLVTVSPATTGYSTMFTSRDDDQTIPGFPVRGGGAKIKVSFGIAEGGTKQLDLGFAEPIELHDGELQWTKNAFTDDCEFSLGVHIPATPVTAVTPGTGNCTLVPYYTFGNVIIPAVGGDYQVDMINDGVPVPSGYDSNMELQGYWDVVYDTGAVALASNPGKAPYHMLDFSMEVWLLRNISMGSERAIFEGDIYTTEWIPPSWSVRLEVSRPTVTTLGAGSVSGFLMLFRKSVT